MNVESNWRILKWTHTHVDGRMVGWMDGWYYRCIYEIKWDDDAHVV